MENNNEIIMYTTDDGITKVEASFDGDMVWLSLDQMAELFQRDKSTVSRHIKNIFTEGELQQSATVANFATVQNEGDRQVERQIIYYNLDVIISVGYRVKSIRGTQFRIWASSILKEYMRKGFAMDDERLKGNGGGAYWKELLDRIRDIRSSEKVLYRQVLDLYATSVDYNPQADESIQFFKIVQNKLHYATHGHTAAEVIFERADAEKPFMGLTTFSGYFDLAEINAIEHKPMYMSDYVEQLDSVLSSGNRKLLQGAGKVSHAQAITKAKSEYRKYQEKTLSPVEEAYIATIKSLEKEAKKNSKK